MTIKIEQALNQKLNNYAISNSFTVKWDFYNDGIEPDIDGIHFRQNLLPAETLIVGMENTGSNDHTGVYQIMVCARAGEPSGELKVQVDYLLNAFRRGQVITYNSQDVIIESASISSPLYSEAYVKVPVSISYRAFVANQSLS